MRARPPILLFIVSAVSLVVYQVVRQLYAPYWQDLANTSFGILAGTPDWLAYQNRLLAPFLISLIALTGISQVSALKVFVLLAVLAQNLLLFFLLRRSNVTGGQAVAAVLAYSMMFLFIQEYSLYPWDFADLLLFLLFAWGVFARKPPLYFVILFFVTILNRESALFISLFMMFDAFEFNGSAPSSGKLTLKSKARLITGILLMLAGILYITAIREVLFVNQPGGFSDSRHEWVGNHFNLPENLFTLFIENFSSLHILNSLFLLGSTAYVFSFARREWKAALLYAAMVFNILVFGVVNENRLYGILLPFLVFFIFVAGDSERANQPN
ncbi:MAG: hypothetical protein DPW18_12125 [Chloroflexi bacterium]|nr:hypothetical protein [Chloroflexota bacterium]MDL1944414.1 hypothetical protein [Chloroflexi bacterium CFX2]